MSKNKSAEDKKMDKLISLAKQRGFIYQSSEIYGGLNSCYDYGPLGVELKNNVKKAWWKAMVQESDQIVGLDSSILMHPKIWEASGHIASFTDPLVDCKKCKKRFRADHLLEAAKNMEPKGVKEDPVELSDLKCPECGGELTGKRDFNLMFKTFMGPVEESAAVVFLRPETAQGIYVNFLNVLESARQKLPFGIAQIGKAFRNEITPGNYTFRTREFEQMEMQWFVKPEDANKWFESWKEKRLNWYKNLGVNMDNIRLHPHGPQELAHYAKAAFDLEYNFPFGWKELEGIHNRGDWDLSRHQKFSGQDLQYRDQLTGEKYTPWIIETSAGADRATLLFLVDAFTEVEGGRTTTTESTKEAEYVLRLHPSLAPIKAAILPLSKKPELAKVAKEIQDALRPHMMTAYDETGSIGKRYRRQDEIGTPYCITVDFDTLNDKAVTVRDRDTMAQSRMSIADLPNYLREKIPSL